MLPSRLLRSASRSPLVKSMRTLGGTNLTFEGNKSQRPEPFDKLEALVNKYRKTLELPPITLESRHKMFIQEVSNYEPLKLSSSWLKSIAHNADIVDKNVATLTRLQHALVKDMLVQEDLAGEFLAVCPNLLLQNLSVTIDRLQQWTFFCQKNKIEPFLAPLCLEPLVLAVPENNWHNQAENLKEFFPQRLLTELISTTPIVLLQNWTEEKRKIRYLLKVMNVPLQDIIKEGVLLHELDFIQTRYEFLERSGLYKHPAPKSVGRVDAASPAIDLVLDPDPREFLAKATDNCLTLEEYNTFLTVFHEEAGLIATSLCHKP